MTTPASSASPAAPAPAARPKTPHPDKALLKAWLLLFLASRESYGWALLHELRDRGIVIDPSLVYRDLRELEHEGTVTSRWMDSGSGPQRRSYRLTRAGRGTLDALAANVRMVWEQHERFAAIYERAHAADATAADGDGSEPRAPAPAPTPTPAGGERGAARPGRELLAAWLLLLLEHSVSYGYELRHELEQHGVDADAATLYRLLRRLERTGWLESRWVNPVAGPRRRLYRVTGPGRRNLDELAELTTRIRDTHGEFLVAYEAQAAKRRRPSRPRRHRKTAEHGD